MNKVKVNCFFTDEGYVCKNMVEVLKFCQKHKDKGGVLTLQLGKEPRSLQQNAWFHSVLLDAFVEATGDYDRDYLKYTLKEKFLKVWLGVDKYWIKDTSQLTVKEFNEFLKACVQLLVEVGGRLTTTEYDEYKESTA